MAEFWSFGLRYLVAQVRLVESHSRLKPWIDGLCYIHTVEIEGYEEFSLFLS